MNNPYSIIFGSEPDQMISRITQREQVLRSFQAKTLSQMVYMITGVRGMGKTVFMTEIADQLRKQSEWIVVELNPERDMLTELASKLSSEHKLAKIFKAAKINLSAWGFGLEVSGTVPITDIDTALERMLESLKKEGKKILITIDEVTNSRQMKVFAGSFQIFLRRKLPLCLLMTGLYENIHSLQNEKNLTFLYRAPRIDLKPLNIGNIASSYKRVFDLDDEASLSMARLTNGYSFAFQVLGYFTWENNCIFDDSVFDLYKQYLDDYVYEKIWSELTRTDRKILYALAQTPSGRVSDVRELAGMTTNNFNPYRQKLIKKGLLNGDEWGYIRFVLPLFDRYVLENYI